MEYQNGQRQQQSGLAVRDGFAGAETMQLAELSSKAVAEQARAQVEARYIMAIKRPRDMDRVRITMLRESARPTFAAVARYAKPIGGSKVEGFSIRFAEAVLRCLGNVHIESITLYDDAEKRIVRVSATDLESNLTLNKDITIQKTVERRNPKAGQTVLGKRTNSGGNTVYIVEATEDDLLTKEAALTSKALRQLSLRLIPGDILDECHTKIMATLQNADAKDPDIEKKRISDAFAQIGVLPDQLAEYLGHKIEQIVPAELTELRQIYAAIADGDATWTEFIEQRRGERAPAQTQATPAAGGAAPSAPAGGGGTAAEKLAQQLKQSTPGQVPEASKSPSSNTTDNVPPPSPTGSPAETSAAEGEFTKNDMDRLKAEVITTSAELVSILGDKGKAEAFMRTGVKTLQGVRTHAHAAERRTQMKRVMALAERDVEIKEAIRHLEKKLTKAAAEPRVLAAAPQLAKGGALVIGLEAATSARDALLRLIEEVDNATVDSTEPVPADDTLWLSPNENTAGDDNEPGSNG